MSEAPRSAVVIMLAALAVSLAPAASASEGSAPGHDGLYVRIGLGAGYVAGSASVAGESASPTMKGASIATELAVGTSLAPGLVIGGGEYSMIVPSPTFTSRGVSGAAGAHHVSGLGPFVDYYFAPRGGLHAQAALLVGGAFVTAKDGRGSAAGFGFGAMIGLGYEVAISERWSLGGVARLAAYRESLSSSDAFTGTDTSAKSTLAMLSPSCLLAVTLR